jgi:aspartate kinase
MIVLKFGGSSVRDAPRLCAVAALVERVLPEQPLVVLSAIGGATDALLALAREPTPAGVAALAARHRGVLRDLGLDESLLDPWLDELEALVRGIALIGEVTPRTLDLLASYGERLVVRVFAAVLRSRGVKATAVDSWQIRMCCDGRFGAARFLPPDRPAVLAALAQLDGVPVVTGYIGRSACGEICTFGRGGSDYSASAIGSAIGAREIQIWTDVDGVMTADPRIVPQARSIDLLSFAEASEVAYYGAKVLHPATIQPAVAEAIPVRVKNTFRPEAPGTLILEQVPSEPAEVSQQARCVVHKRDVTLINLTSTKMLAQSGFLARVFEVFARYAVVVDMVATSEVSVSLTCERQYSIEAVLVDLEQLGEVEVERGVAMISLVGRGFRHARGIAARVFGAMARSRIGVRMISAGAIKISVAFLVNEVDLEPAVRALHGEFLENLTTE